MLKRISLAAFAIALAAPAAADSFLPPAVTESYSPSNNAVVTIVPAWLSCAKDETDCEPAARAIVSYVYGDHRSGARTVKLVNRDAPGQALVTDGGQRLLTVNEYAAFGFGENTLVIYDETGAVIARHSLVDFLPEDYVNGLPRTASTIRWWADDVRIERESHRAIISVLLVDEEVYGAPFSDRKGLELAVDLDTGEVERPSGPRWEKALNCARANVWVVQDKKAERERERYRALCRK